MLSLGLCSCSDKKTKAVEINLGDRISHTSSIDSVYPNAAKMCIGNVEFLHDGLDNLEFASGVQIANSDYDYAKPVEEVRVNDMTTELFILIIAFIAIGVYQIFVPVPLHVLLQRLDLNMPVPEEELKIGFELSFRSILGIVMVLIGVAIFFIFII